MNCCCDVLSITSERALHVLFVNYFEAMTRRPRRQIINRTCKIRIFTHLKMVWYQKLDLKNNLFIDRNMAKTGVLN